MDLSNKNVVHIKKNGTEYLQFRKLLEYDNIITHAYSLGIDKNYRIAKTKGQKSTENGYKESIDDYKVLCDELGVDYKNLVKTNQTHTDNVKIINNKILSDLPDFNLDEYKETDGLITNRRNIILATTNADCILLLFFDPVKKVIANVHSGWRGTIQKISVKTIEKMVKEFNCKEKDIICCMCPSIGKCHFEVEKDVKDMFEKEFKDTEGIDISKVIEEKIKDKKWNIDTISINRQILKNVGLKEENIIDSGLCSVCHCDKIHSYRVEKQEYGLNVALISRGRSFNP